MCAIFAYIIGWLCSSIDAVCSFARMPRVLALLQFSVFTCLTTGAGQYSALHSNSHCCTFGKEDMGRASANDLLQLAKALLTWQACSKIISSKSYRTGAAWQYTRVRATGKELVHNFIVRTVVIVVGKWGLTAGVRSSSSQPGRIFERLLLPLMLCMCL